VAIDVRIRNWVDLDETGDAWPVDGFDDTFAHFHRPYKASQVLKLDEQEDLEAYNYGTDPLPDAFVRARVPTWDPPGHPNLTAWRAHLASHVIPRLQFSLDGTTWGSMGAPLSLGTINPSDGVYFYTRLTTVVTDTRTGLAYDYGLTANPNDYPTAFTLYVTGGVAVARRRFPQLIGQ
jgi:hypothetical protein